MKRKLIIATAVLALGVGAGLARAEPTHNQYARAYVDPYALGNSIEAHGAPYGGRRIAIDTALCQGLRRYGVRSSAYGLDKFWRFKCSLIGANEHYYTAQLSTTRGPRLGKIYTHFLSVRRDF